MKSGIAALLLLLAASAQSVKPESLEFHVTRSNNGAFMNVLTCKNVPNSKLVKDCKLGEGFTLDDAVNSMRGLDPCADKPLRPAIYVGGSSENSTYGTVQNSTPCGTGVVIKGGSKGDKFDSVNTGKKPDKD